jgi:hypothetical protein
MANLNLEYQVPVQAAQGWAGAFFERLFAIVFAIFPMFLLI